MHPLALKSLMIGVMLCLFGLALVLWKATPELYIYFNQAFCAH